MNASIWMAGCFALLCAAMVVERRLNDAVRRSLPTVIHINGIRGKTSVCRMLDAALRGRYRVLTKTTGSDARVLHVNGKDLRIRRLGSSNIREQLWAMRLARRERAEVVILECMAVRPDLQKISERQMLKSDIAVITNVRYDHVLEMGESLSSIAEALSGCVPENGALYTADEAFFPFFERKCAERGSHAVFCEPDAGGNGNEAIVRRIAMSLGATEAEIDEGLSRVQADPGMREWFVGRNEKGERFDFLNLFAANDPISALQKAGDAARGRAEVRFVYNNRWDRPDRVKLFAERFFPAFPQARIYLLGDSKPLMGRAFGKKGGLRTQAVRRADECLQMPAGSLLIGVGNIKGQGQSLLLALEDGHE